MHEFQSPFLLLCESNEHRDGAKRNRGGVRAIRERKSQTNTEMEQSGIEVVFVLFGKGKVKRTPRWSKAESRWCSCYSGKEKSNEHRDEAKRNRGGVRRLLLKACGSNEHRDEAKRNRGERSPFVVEGM